MRMVLKHFDSYLEGKGLKFQGHVIGGAALILLDVITRATRDVDFLDPDIPVEIKKASVDFVEFAKKNHQLELDENWFNEGPSSLKRDLPKNWKANGRLLYQGKSLVLYTLSHLDLIRTKLFAYCDRQEDEDDCLHLKPSIEELHTSLKWVADRDGNPFWPDHVRESFLGLAEKLGYGEEFEEKLKGSKE